MHSSYISPIDTRYKAPILSKLWSPDSKIILMRNLWLDLAIFQKQLGITSITDEGILEMQNAIPNVIQNANIDYDKINDYERRYKHDIIAHIHAFSDICPKAKSFIHLGATSNFINDNVDMIIIKQSLDTISTLISNLFYTLKEKSEQYKSTPTLAYTHLQQAQLTTIGKRFAMWNSDIVLDIESLKMLQMKLPFRGLKGTTGTEDTILKLFEGDHYKCYLLNKYLANKYGFTDEQSLIICGQTYSRKYDVMVFQLMSSICQSIYKMMNDIRLLSGKGEIYESFGKEQVGSSAMPYKKNPITCEKICSLARYVINQESIMTQTYINQWLERSLDDSAVKRIIYPECFMLLENIITETTKCIDTLVINEEYIKKQVELSMHNIITEELILNGVKMGYVRIDIHDRIRSILTKPMKCYEEDNLFENKYNIEMIKKIFESDEIISGIIKTYNISLEPLDYIGRCIEQINTFYSHNDNDDNDYDNKMEIQ
jgi:adenylosuccinate lyase